MIHQRDFKGGQQIVELRLAEQLGISRTPIRQALMRLEGEGLLQKSGSRHYFVRRVELQEYLHSLKVRELLEAEAAYKNKVGVEYKLNPNFSVIGNVDESGQVQMKFRVRRVY